MHGVVQVHRRQGRRVTEPVRHSPEARDLEDARDGQVVAPTEEGKAQQDLLGGHVSGGRHHGPTLRCEGAVQVDIRELAADTDA